MQNVHTLLNSTSDFENCICSIGFTYLHQSKITYMQKHTDVTQYIQNKNKSTTPKKTKARNDSLTLSPSKSPKLTFSLALALSLQ